ncbi:MAG: GYF domain-containing protein, partial [Pseudomonadota bacterium]
MSGTDTPTSETQWFVAREGQQHGPLSEAEMRLFVQGGHLKPTDLIWKAGFPDWKPAPAVFPPKADLDHTFADGNAKQASTNASEPAKSGHSDAATGFDTDAKAQSSNDDNDGHSKDLAEQRAEEPEPAATASSSEDVTVEDASSDGIEAKHSAEKDGDETTTSQADENETLETHAETQTSDAVEAPAGTSHADDTAKTAHSDIDEETETQQQDAAAQAPAASSASVSDKVSKIDDPSAEKDASASKDAADALGSDGEGVEEPDAISSKGDAADQDAPENKDSATASPKDTADKPASKSKNPFDPKVWEAEESKHHNPAYSQQSKRPGAP